MVNVPARARRYDEAAEQLHRMLEMDANFAQTYLWLGLVRQAQGRWGESAEAFEKGAHLTGGSPTMRSGLAMTRALSGDTAEAKRLLAEMEERTKTGYVPMVTMVQIHLALGDDDRSFEWLEKAFAYRASFMMPLSVYPFFDSILGDPRFDDLLRRQEAPS